MILGPVGVRRKNQALPLLLSQHVPMAAPHPPYIAQLEMPVIGMESEFKVFVNDAEVTPEEHWRTPQQLIEGPVLRRSSKAVQLPTGGALYFDGGVIEVVTPVIEIAPQCTARMVRSLWDQIDFLRRQLDGWEERHGERVRLQGFSSHFNISFEVPREQRNRRRTIQKLAFVLARLLPVPVMVAGGNRRSTGIGVRPRRDRIEITVDFTPDPGQMGATAAVIIGLARDVIAWPSYLVEEIEKRSIPTIVGVEPAKHPSRNGWIVRAEHFPTNPWRCDADEACWDTTAGAMSLRQIAHETASAFRDSIREHADAASFDRLFAIYRGDSPSLLDQPDRPADYDDIGRKPRAHDERLSRSEYEKVFIRVATGRGLQIGGELLTPIAVKGWYHSVFRTPAGEERLMTLDQILAARGHWLA